MAKDDIRTSVKMKFVGRFKGLSKVVELPIPLVSNSQKLEQTLVFTRHDPKGPAFCDVPMDWVGALLNVGGNWQLAEKLTPELQAQIDTAKEACAIRMSAFAIENELVEA